MRLMHSLIKDFLPSIEISSSRSLSAVAAHYVAKLRIFLDILQPSQRYYRYGQRFSIPALKIAKNRREEAATPVGTYGPCVLGVRYQRIDFHGIAGTPPAPGPDAPALPEGHAHSQTHEPYVPTPSIRPAAPQQRQRAGGAARRFLLLALKLLIGNYSAADD